MTRADGKAKVRADIGENILYITLTGIIRKKSLDSLYTDIRFCVADLKPGFAVITDLSEARIGHLSAITTFKKITSYLLDNKAGHVIRIVGRNDLIFKQVSRISASIQGYKPIYVSSLDEAREKLAEQYKTA